MNKVNFLPKFAITVILTACLCSCAQLKYRPLIVDESKENNVKIEYKYTHDTVYLQDSSVTSFRNDTIFAEKWHIKYVSKAVHDTVIAKDTVLVTKIETKEIKTKTPTFKEKFGGFILAMGFGMLICLIIYILTKIKTWK